MLQNKYLSSTLMLGIVTMAMSCGAENDSTCEASPGDLHPPIEQCRARNNCTLEAQMRRECTPCTPSNTDVDGDCVSDVDENRDCVASRRADAITDPTVWPSAPDTVTDNGKDADCDGNDGPRSGIGNGTSSGGTSSSSSSSSSGGTVSRCASVTCATGFQCLDTGSAAQCVPIQVGSDDGGLNGPSCSCSGRTSQIFSTFSNGTDGWFLEDKHAGGAGSGNMSTMNGQLRCQSGGGYATDDEVMCRMNVSVVQGSTYCLTMDVSSALPRSFKVQVRRSVSPWSSHGLYAPSVSATPTTATKSGRFISDATNGSAEITVMVGTSIIPVFLDNVAFCQL